MLSTPGTGWAVPRRLAALGEVATIATTVRRLLGSVRAERESRLTWIAPSALDATDQQWRVPARLPVRVSAQLPTPASRPRADRTPPGNGPALPVLLVHGYLGTPSCWDRLVPRLHDAGVDDVFTFGYNAIASTIPLLAADLVRAAELAMDRTRTNGIHLAGHSLGGLVIRYAVQRLGLSAVADAVVTIATPHRGSPLAVVAPGVAGAQMRPGSALLHHLPPLWSTSGVRWLVVDSDQDLVVPPSLPPTTDSPPEGPPADTLRADSIAVGAGGASVASGAVEHVVVSGIGHQGILRSPQVCDAVVRHLEQVTAARHAAGRPAAAA